MAQQSELLLIGAGALGMRHLQSMVQLASVRIWVVEPDLAAQQRCQQHLLALGPQAMPNQVQWLTALPQQSISFDAAVVATSAGPRFAVVQVLLERFKVRFLILEKVLFQRLDQYAAIADLLKRSATIAYVNCPRRLYPLYQCIQQQLDPTKPLHLAVSGQNWGLACNSVHFIDLVSWLTQSPADTVDGTALLPNIYPSKRLGYQEVAGKLRIKFANGSVLMLNCDVIAEAPVIMHIELQQTDMHWLIDEGTGLVQQTVAGSRQQLQLARAPYQSELTAQVIADLLLTGQCALPGFTEASHCHQLLIENLLAFFSRQLGKPQNVCPIT
jgi:predicted dehydrogenase